MANTVTKLERKRFSDLWDKAVTRYLEDQEFYPEDWLSPEDAKEYEALDRKLHGQK